MLVHDLGAGTGEHGSAPVQHALIKYIVSVIKQFTDSWCVLVTITISFTLLQKRNVVVSGVPESACESLHDQQSADLVSFTQLCEENLPVKPSISKQGCKRLGRCNDDAAKPRKLQFRVSCH